MILLQQANNLLLVQLIKADRGLTNAQTFLQNHLQTMNFMHIQQQQSFGWEWVDQTLEDLFGDDACFSAKRVHHRQTCSHKCIYHFQLSSYEHFKDTLLIKQSNYLPKVGCIFSVERLLACFFAVVVVHSCFKLASCKRTLFKGLHLVEMLKDLGNKSYGSWIIHQADHKHKYNVIISELAIHFFPHFWNILYRGLG